MITTAYRFTKSGSADWIERDDSYPVADLGPHDVRVAVRAVSLNYRDLIHAKKQMGRDFAGVVPCSDGAGEVVAVGTGVTRVSPGDRVCGIFFQTWRDGPFTMAHHAAALGGSANGMLAKEVVLNEGGLVKFPDYLSYEDAATLPCAAVTVWQSIVARGGFQKGETVLCLGTGGVSVFALQFAVALGGTVAITSGSEEKLAKAKALGAAFGVNYKAKPDWDKEVWTWSGKQGVNHVVEVGGPGTLGKSLACVAPNGHVAMVGVLTGAGAPDASLFPLVGKNATIHGIYVGSRAHFEAMNRFLDEAKVKPVIDRVFGFDEAANAFKYLESGSHFGKVVLRI